MKAVKLGSVHGLDGLTSPRRFEVERPPTCDTTWRHGSRVRNGHERGSAYWNPRARHGPEGNLACLRRPTGGRAVETPAASPWSVRGGTVLPSCHIEKSLRASGPLGRPSPGGGSLSSEASSLARASSWAASTRRQAAKESCERAHSSIRPERAAWRSSSFVRAVKNVRSAAVGAATDCHIPINVPPHSMRCVTHVHAPASPAMAPTGTGSSAGAWMALEARASGASGGRASEASGGATVTAASAAEEASSGGAGPRASGRVMSGQVGLQAPNAARLAHATASSPGSLTQEGGRVAREKMATARSPQ